jgi:hypothetical protein
MLTEFKRGFENNQMINFLNPLWLLAVPVVLSTLFALYLRKGKSQKIRVSSLFFIGKLPADAPSSRKKFNIPLRLIIESLIFILLLSAVAGMILKDNSKKLTIVLDNSLRMLTKAEPDQLASKSIFELAKTEALSHLDFAPGLAKVSIWITSPSATNISNGFVDKSEARQIISEIKAAYSEAELDLALSKVSSETLVFSDARSKEADYYSAAESMIRFADFGVPKKSRENIALESLTVRENSLSLKLKAFIVKKAKCSVSLYSYDQNWNKISDRQIELDPLSSSSEIIFNLPNRQLPVAIKASLSSCSRIEANALLEDDSVWLSPKNISNKISFISNFSLKDLKLDQLQNLNFELVAPKEWEKQPKSIGSAVFHRYIPTTLPNLNSLFIYPENSVEWLDLIALSEKNELIDWDKNNPILQYLNFPNLVFENSVIFRKLPNWASPLLKSAAGDIAFYASKDSKRYAAIGFELFPFEGKQNSTLSILTLNLFEWIKNNESANNSLSFSVELLLKQVLALDSALEAPQVKMAKDGMRFSTNSPGLYAAEMQDKNIVVAANLFLQTQSNLLEENLIQLKQTPAVSKVDDVDNPGDSLFKWLCIMAILVILVDVLLILRKRRLNAV